MRVSQVFRVIIFKDTHPFLLGNKLPFCIGCLKLVEVDYPVCISIDLDGIFIFRADGLHQLDGGLAESADVNEIFHCFVVSVNILFQRASLVYSSHLCLSHVLLNHHHHNRVVNEFIHLFKAEPKEESVYIYNFQFLLVMALVFKMPKEVVSSIFQ